MTDLERLLLAVGRELYVPETPELAPRVLSAVERPVVRLIRRRVGLALAVVAAAALAATLAIPDARSALLRILHIGGERIELVDDLSAVSPEPSELDLGRAIGERVSLPAARQRAGFDLLELAARPDRVYLGGRGTVWFLYGRPAAVRLLVAQTPRLGVDEPFIVKKLAASGTRVEAATVRGARAYFLSGEPHIVLLVDERGESLVETVRLARNVLVWEASGVTYRLEGDFTRDEARALAESLR